MDTWDHMWQTRFQLCSAASMKVQLLSSLNWLVTTSHCDARCWKKYWYWVSREHSGKKKKQLQMYCFGHRKLERWPSICLVISFFSLNSYSSYSWLLTHCRTRDYWHPRFFFSSSNRKKKAKEKKELDFLEVVACSCCYPFSSLQQWLLIAKSRKAVNCGPRIVI